MYYLNDPPLNIKAERDRVCLSVPFSSTPAHEPSHSASRGSPGSQSAVVMGTRQRWLVPSSLLYSPVQRASRQQLDCSLCISQSWNKLLYSGQVNTKVCFNNCITLIIVSGSVWHIHAFFSPSRLKPFTSYQFRVKATNDIGDSEYCEESEAITTLQDGKNLWLTQHAPQRHYLLIFPLSF